MRGQDLPRVRSDTGPAGIARFFVMVAIVVLLTGTTQLGWMMLAAVVGGVGVSAVLFVWHRHTAPLRQPRRLFDR